MKLSKNIVYVGTLETLTCGSCGIPFALPVEMHRRVRQTGEFFYCPNGDKIHYFDDDNARLKRELAAAKGNARVYLERLESEKRSKAAVKGHLTRTQNRIKNGVCPCCNRHFANLERHMSGQHPEFAK